MHLADNETIIDSISDLSGWQIIFEESWNSVCKRIYCRSLRNNNMMMTAICPVSVLKELPK